MSQPAHIAANRRISLLSYAVAVLGVGVLLIAIGAAISRLTTPAPAPPKPPLEYTQQYYQADKLVYLPGETAHISPTLNYRDWGPATFTRSFWRRDSGQPGGSSPRLCDGTTLIEGRSWKLNLPFEVVGVYREGNTGEVIPDLVPGQYWIVGSVVGSLGGKAQFQVPIVIARPCG